MENTDTRSQTDTQARQGQNIQQGHTELQHKYTSNNIGFTAP